MCQQNKRRVKDLLIAGGDAAAAAASDDDNNELSPFEFAMFANSFPSSQSITRFTWPATALENKPKTIVDTSNFHEQDLELLKKQDPFLYFSIPAVHHAAVVRNSRDIDMSALQGNRSKATSRRASCPSRIPQSSKTSTKVERKSRISFECHTDLLLEELMDDFDDMSMQELQKVKMDVISSPSSQSSQSITRFTWPATALENKPKTIVDTSNLHEQDLELLKKQDPFLYFSIPAVHHAAVVRNSRDIDMSALQGNRSKATSRRASCPSRIPQSSKTSTKVERKSRISFECHTDLLLEELMDDFDDMSMQELQQVKKDAQQ